VVLLRAIPEEPAEHDGRQDEEDAVEDECGLSVD
jgi:hypothetical protein